MKRLLFKPLHRWTGYARLQKLLSSSENESPLQFLRRANDEYQVKPKVHLRPGTSFRSTVFVSNHHTGAMDFLATYPELSQVAPDLKIVVNNELLQLKPLRDIFIGVHPLSSGLRNDKAKELLAKHLQAGGNVLIYPAGKVGGKSSGEIGDAPWRQGIADLICEHASSVVPVYVDAENSEMFYFIRKFFPKISMLLLLRELKAHRGQVRVVVGEAIPVNHLQTQPAPVLMSRLREQVYSLKKIGGDDAKL